MLPEKLTKNILRMEVACKCCHKCEIQMSAVQALQLVREDTGEAIIINRGYSCAEHNKRIGGAKNSMHLYGHAFDLSTKGDANYRAKLIAALCNHGFTFLIIYPNWVHADRRVGPVRIHWSDGKNLS